MATSSSSSSLSKKSGTKSEFVRGLAMKARPLSSHAHPLSTSFSSSSSSSLRMTTTQTTTPSKAKRRTAKPPTSTFTTPDDDESDANISGIAFKSLVSTWNDASVSEREELLKKITGCDPLQLKYDEKEVIDFLTFSIEIDKIIHRQQYLNDESWFRWVQERQNFHDTCEEIHLNSSRYIKREIAKQLLEERHRLGDALFWQAMGDEDSFLSHNTHWLIVVERGAPEKTRTLRASEYTDIMMEKGRGNIVESTILNGCMAGLHQQGLVQSDPKGGCCTTKFALFDLFYCTAEQAFFNENENIQYVLFSCSDLLASIGPKHWKANNEGFIPRDEVIDLHVRARPKQGYAGIAGKIVVEAMRLSAEALAKLCQKYNIFIIVHSAKVRDVLAGSETRVRLRLWFERTLAHSCAPCCHAFGGRWSGLSIGSLTSSMDMNRSGCKQELLESLLVQSSKAFQVYRGIIQKRQGVYGNDETVQNAMNICIERVLASAEELSSDENPVKTFGDLFMALSRKPFSKYEDLSALGFKVGVFANGSNDRKKKSTYMRDTNTETLQPALEAKINWEKMMEENFWGTRIVDGKLNYCCPLGKVPGCEGVCDYETDKKSNLKRHIASDKRIIETRREALEKGTLRDKEFFCKHEDCKNCAGFGTNFALTRHMKEVHGEKAIACNFCGDQWPATRPEKLRDHEQSCPKRKQAE